MRGNESWSFWNRPFAIAVLMSLLWHFFWCFSIVVTVNPSQALAKSKPKIISIGPVLDDTIFRILAETKPQLSETFYRHLTDFSKPLDVETKTIERHEPGGVVSMPLSDRLGTLMRGVLGGEKTMPDYEFTSRIS